MNMKRLDKQRKDKYWHDIPLGKSHAISYAELEKKWGLKERSVRMILSSLSSYDAPDDTILIRSSGSRGFYRTADLEEIEAYRRECLNRAYACMSPAKRCKRIIDKIKGKQGSLFADLDDF